MKNTLSHYRTTLLINGIIAILFGLFAIFVPEETSTTVAMYFGIVLLIGGGFGLVNAINLMKRKHDYLSPLVNSIVGILVGLFIVIYTNRSLEIFAIILGIWAVILGFVQFFIALNLFPSGRNKNIIIFNSIITLVFGLILFFNPFNSVVALIFLVGALALIFGGVLVYFSFIIGSISEEDN
jgi:uncharacterized membrane protein HdeD (DUF308 family)